MIILDVFFSLSITLPFSSNGREREGKLLIIYSQHPLIMTGRREQDRLRTTGEEEEEKEKEKEEDEGKRNDYAWESDTLI